MAKKDVYYPFCKQLQEASDASASAYKELLWLGRELADIGTTPPAYTDVRELYEEIERMRKVEHEHFMRILELQEKYCRRYTFE